jgi:hypothetical protein
MDDVIAVIKGMGLQWFGEGEAVPAGDPAPDAGDPGGNPAGGPDPGAGGGDPAGGGGEDDADFKGWWASQLPKEARDRHREGLLSLKDKRLSEVFDDYFQSRERLKGSIAFPGKDAKPEEIEAFLKRMDIPLKAEGYGLDAGKLPAGWTAGDKARTVKDVSEHLKKNGLTAKQGAAMFELYAQSVNDSIEAAKRRVKEMAATVDQRLEKDCGDSKATEEAKENFKRAMTALNDREFVRAMKDSGMIYNTSVIRAIADLWKAGNTEPPVMGGGKGREGTASGGLPKGEEFAKRYGGRRA